MTARLSYPRGVDIGDIEGISELAFSELSECEIRSISVNWGFDIPGIGFDRDMVFEQGVGWCGVEVCWSWVFLTLSGVI